MAIKTENPLTLPPRPALLADNIGHRRIVIEWPDVNGQPHAAVESFLYATDPLTGANTEAPGSAVSWARADLFTLAAQDPEVAEVLVKLSAVLARYGRAAGAFA